MQLQKIGDHFPPLGEFLIAPYAINYLISLWELCYATGSVFQWLASVE
jgi:hypothetical protein